MVTAACARSRVLPRMASKWSSQSPGHVEAQAGHHVAPAAERGRPRRAVHPVAVAGHGAVGAQHHALEGGGAAAPVHQPDLEVEEAAEGQRIRGPRHLHPEGFGVAAERGGQGGPGGGRHPGDGRHVLAERARGTPAAEKSSARSSARSATYTRPRASTAIDCGYRHAAGSGPRPLRLHGPDQPAGTADGREAVHRAATHVRGVHDAGRVDGDAPDGAEPVRAAARTRTGTRPWSRRRRRCAGSPTPRRKARAPARRRRPRRGRPASRGPRPSRRAPCPWPAPRGRRPGCGRCACPRRTRGRAARAGSRRRRARSGPSGRRWPARSSRTAARGAATRPSARPATSKTWTRWLKVSATYT